MRRQLIDKFGENAEDGPNSVYAGGLWVRTSLDLELQDAARDALRAQLLSYQGNRGFSGPIATLNPDNGDLIGQLRSSNLSINYEDWRVGVVTEGGSSPKIGLTDGETYSLLGAPGSLNVGDVVAAQQAAPVAPQEEEAAFGGNAGALAAAFALFVLVVFIVADSEDDPVSP